MMWSVRWNSILMLCGVILGKRVISFVINLLFSLVWNCVVIICQIVVVLVVVGGVQLMMVVYCEMMVLLMLLGWFVVMNSRLLKYFSVCRNLVMMVFCLMLLFCWIMNMFVLLRRRMQFQWFLCWKIIFRFFLMVLVVVFRVFEWIEYSGCLISFVQILVVKVLLILGMFLQRIMLLVFLFFMKLLMNVLRFVVRMFSRLWWVGGRISLLCSDLLQLCGFMLFVCIQKNLCVCRLKILIIGCFGSSLSLLFLVNRYDLVLCCVGVQFFELRL